ncbi:MAG: radical SAM protein [Planctomycetes bacterium]|nr:radical SAM protein [Planctomycetota bacterium]
MAADTHASHLRVPFDQGNSAMNSTTIRVNLVSTNEGEFQPLGIASPAAYLRRKNYLVNTIDLSKETIGILDADVLAFSVPIFGSIDSSVQEASRARKEGFEGPIIFYNQYATVQPETFLLDSRCHVILGEFEEVLCDVVDRVTANRPIEGAPHVWSGQEVQPAKCFRRNEFFTPDRSTLPPLSAYARTNEGVIIGNVETMRGCAHDCTYCSVYAAYEKRVVKINEDAILQDIQNVVRMGARHITFIDADFFSTGKRGLALIEKMKERFSSLSFDITCRLDDMLRYKTILERFKQLGCVEITTAVEFPKEEVLVAVVKKITMQQTYDAIRLCQEIGIRLKPTFITYTPWITKEDLAHFEAFIQEMNIADQVDTLQRQTRLLLYKGAPLLKTGVLDNIPLVEHSTYYEWIHHDEEVDTAYLSSLTPGTTGIKRCCIKG